MRGNGEERHCLRQAPPHQVDATWPGASCGGRPTGPAAAARRRLVPARAGQPVERYPARHWPRAYPRSRGATHHPRRRLRAAPGLSPLAQGNLGRTGAHPDVQGPIPARAGQPKARSRCRWPSRAYPRSRGNRFRACTNTLPYGPIPARAGQPDPNPASSCWHRAYPRSRGATRRAQDGADEAGGLSPLARGNLQRRVIDAHVVGPIPARAGQPSSASFSPRLSWAYPRSRGATLLTTHHSARSVGLSPLARGNLEQAGVLTDALGPIPARAGQPARMPLIASLMRAYPRSRGATHFCSADSPAQSGLSPLARGNPLSTGRELVILGPIPARAGQPPAHRKGGCR